MAPRRTSEEEPVGLAARSGKWFCGPTDSGEPPRGRIRRWLCSSHDVANVKLPSDDDSIAEATGAVVAHVLSRPDSIRQRAQNAATISGAITVALVVAAVTGLSDAGEPLRPWTTWLVGAAIVAFAISTGLSVYAVVFPHRRTGELDYFELVAQYERYADEVRQKMRWAAAAAAVALAITAAAAIAEIAERASSNDVPMDLVLTDEAMSAVSSLCGWGGKVGPAITGELSEEDLTKDIVEISAAEVEQAPCCGTLKLSRRLIRVAKKAPADRKRQRC
jgi:hypothetical protein